MRLWLANAGPATGAVIEATLLGRRVCRQDIDLPPGESACELFVPAADTVQEYVFALYGPAGRLHEKAALLPPARPWVVHVVQASHHDPGYTDLPSSVLREHLRHLDEAVEHAGATDGYPADARFRIVIEQAWSLRHYLKSAPAERVEKMLGLLRAGRFELTALFGNMTSELCGHEGLIRAAYPAADIGRQYGIPILTAEHNDVPGLSWGLARVLCGIGVRLFCPGLPLYYGWAAEQLRSFWDEEAIFGRRGPGAFWWEAPDGGRVLLWSGNTGCGGDCRASLPTLAGALEELEHNGYPCNVLRWPVNGSARDNSPYIPGYADSIRAWNAQWLYPRLVCSTNTMFYRDLLPALPPDLPVWRGELPGQDYPSGATSTAGPTAVGRRNHAALPAAEQLATAAGLGAGAAWPAGRLAEAWEDTLWFDEHAWGYHFPAGPAARASEYEKAVHAYRAEAFTAEIRDKAMARMADSLRLPAGEMYLVVFNTTSWPLSGPLEVPLRELDGTGNTLRAVPPEQDPQGAGMLKGTLLDTRWHVHPDHTWLDGRFALVDAETGAEVPHDLVELEDYLSPEEYAPQRLGLGRGTRRYGFFEEPAVLRYTLRLVARDIPAHGYRAYRLERRRAPGGIPAAELICGQAHIENAFFRITADPDTRQIVGIFDKTTRRQLADPAGGGFYRLLVRQPGTAQAAEETRTALATRAGRTYAELRLDSSAPGCPAVRHTLTLYAGTDTLHLATTLLKDPTPLQNVHLAFPFAAASPVFRYEGVLSALEPVRDFLPGAYSDVLSPQSWVRVWDGSGHILWAGLDTPVAGFGELWPGYVSPAHRCVADGSFNHSPQTGADYQKNGWIFSQLLNNDFGTNFAVSQCGLLLFRYRIAAGAGPAHDAAAARWGWQQAAPPATLFTDRAGPQGRLPASGRWLEIDNPNLPVLCWKAAQDGQGTILRLWNQTDTPQRAEVRLPGLAATGAGLASLVEEDLPQNGPAGNSCRLDGGRVVVCAAARQVVTLRIEAGGGDAACL